ncbi:hypothetical protein B0J12DRAFT_380735 [Macrophomina phaseolina]|uniref:Uncharacterized protein n=1 Tax=Macrophomina phaseolina TaxID=35725 RepID=A0ABQ8GKS6_9PEZI|nr:hypothetical protein B0J12DRAFT_380735 [Macrophomina phaseolina]
MQHEFHQDPSEPARYGERRRRTGFFRILQAWYFFPFHAILVIALGLTALLVLEGKTFPSSADAPIGSTISHIFRGKLRQADVTTLISAALVLIRLTLNVCSATAAHRSIFILLEKCGITLREIERIFAFEQGPLGTNRFKVGVVALLLLLVPAQLSAPLAQGAVTWNPQLSLKPADFNVSLFVATDGPDFVYFQSRSSNREFSVRRASGLAVIHRFGPDFYSVFDAEKKVPSRRWAPAFSEHEPSDHTKGYKALPDNTTVANTTLPYFRISNFNWIDYDDSLADFLDNDNGLFNVTGQQNPITTPLLGNAVLLRSSPMDAWLSSWPKPTLLNSTYKVAILAEQLEDGASTGNCTGFSTKFGSLPDKKQYSSKGNCYLFGEVSVVAGSTRCFDCSIIASGVVERPGNATFDFVVSDDTLVDLVMGMLPETMLAIITANATYAPTWDNLDGFVAGAFSAAYQASWNDLTDRFLGGQTSTNISLPSYPSRADIDAQRVKIWMALHLLVVLSGLILAALQSRCYQPAVVDFPSACLLTDASSVIRSSDASDVRTTAYITSAQSARIGRLILREDGSSDLSSRYRVLKRKKDGGRGQELRFRRATAKRESWSDLSLLSRGSTLYDRVPSAQSTPQTGQSWQSYSPGSARRPPSRE